jgi:hypothetical protein
MFFCDSTAGEDEALYRKRLLEEKYILDRVIERINLKHTSLTEVIFIFIFLFFLFIFFILGI